MIKFFCASCDPDQLTQNVIQNPHVNKHGIEIQFDHNRDKGLPERYNEYIEQNLNEDCWLVFIHDDVELLEDIALKLEGIPKNIIYGACGAKKSNGKGEIVGQILCQDPRIHNGNKFVPVYISENMVGHRLGEFAPSRTFRDHGGRKTERVVRLKK